MSDQKPGIKSIGAYIPRMRLDRATIVNANGWASPALLAHRKGQRAICDWDEDAVTMATDAARACLPNHGAPQPGALYLASTTLPFSDRLNSAIVSEALGFSSRVSTLDLAHGRRAGTSALKLALESAAPGQDVLVAASDHRRTQPGSVQELLYGDAAAAVTVGPGKVIARLLGSATATHDFVDHFRSHPDGWDYAWEERWIRREGYLKQVAPVVQRALEDAGVAAAQIDHFIMPCVYRGVRETICRQAGISAESIQDDFMARCGDSGAAHALLMLAASLGRARPGQVLVVAGFGQGVDVLVLQATDEISARSAPCPVSRQLEDASPESNYTKFLSFNGNIGMHWGARAEVDRKTSLSAAYRNRDFVSMTGGKCSRCRTVQFPRSVVCVNPDCGASRTQKPHRLAEEPGTIQSATSDWLANSLHPPHHYGMVRLESGAKVMLEYTSDTHLTPEVGMPVRLCFRIKAKDEKRGFRSYFWKASIDTREAG